MAGLKRERVRRIFMAVAMMIVVAAAASCVPKDGAKDGSGQVTEANAQAEHETGGTLETGENGDGTDSEDSQDTAQEAGAPISVNNDTVELGTLAVFEPSDNLEANSGRAITGSDEEQLQQERIAGGAVGEVVSGNLEPLNGITDYSEGEFVMVYGVTAE